MACVCGRAGWPAGKTVVRFAAFAASLRAGASGAGAAFLMVSALMLSSASSVEAAASALFTAPGSFNCCGLLEAGLAVLPLASVLAATGLGRLLAGAIAGAALGRLASSSVSSWLVSAFAAATAGAEEVAFGA